MSDAALREAMVRMATDADFAGRVREQGPAVARECGLSESELATLQALGQSDAPAGPTQMGERLSKSGLFGAGALVSALHLGAGDFGLLCNGHSLVCNGHAQLQCNDYAQLQCNDHGFLCDGHSLLCNGHAQLQCNDHGFLCDGHSLLCDGHAGIQCDGHAGIQCDGHAKLQCNEHGLLCDGHSLLCDGHAGIQCDGHAGIQCNGHDDAGVVKCNAHALGLLPAVQTHVSVPTADAHHAVTGIQCNGHAAIQCNEHDTHDDAGVVKCNAHLADLKVSTDLHAPVLGAPGVQSLLGGADAKPS